MKAVLISIKPKWCEKIANGEKTIEVRKSRPKLETPFKVYIYCTKHRKDMFWINEEIKDIDGLPKGLKAYNSRLGNCSIIGEFVCDEITEYRAEFTDLQFSDARHKEVCQNTIKWVERDDENEETVYRYETSNEEDDPDNCKFLKRSCLTFNEVRKYIGETFFDIPFYGWHITDLKIYDKPKELSEFYLQCEEYGKTGTIDTPKKCKKCRYQYTWDLASKCRIDGLKPITRPPQSWCYVEV